MMITTTDSTIFVRREKSIDGMGRIVTGWLLADVR
jgi:hypothetical protein